VHERGARLVEAHFEAERPVVLDRDERLAGLAMLPDPRASR